ncbi:MAG: protein-L-isoaspartate O-methyltransferase [Hyphomonadaceae bacterium]|nr:protein-L-isoaspartate O-methyltransferase [Hyphomonadaceae bacterium]
MDFARARDGMVESQVRTNDVTDPRILHAMRTLPRERFVPAHKRALAYADAEVEVARGRTLLRPRDLAKLIHALAPQAHERGLEIAGATAYGGAVLAACCKEVVAVDPDPELSLAARAALESCGLGGVRTASTGIADGWRDGAPYDVIMLNGACEIVPDAWLDQLADNGRLAVIVRQGPAGSARVYTKTKGAVASRSVFDAAPPLAPGLSRPPAFAF